MGGGGWGNWADCHVPSSPYIEQFDQIMNYRCGDPDCEGGSGSWSNAVCLQNAVIRYARAGRSSQFSDVLSGCYWREKVGCPEHCYIEEIFDLDVYIGKVTNRQLSWFHAICALYKGGDVRIITNWQFFQYNNTDIPPGRNYQIPAGDPAEDTVLEIFQVTGIPDCSHYDRGSIPVAAFRINSQGTPRCTYPPP